MKQYRNLVNKTVIATGFAVAMTLCTNMLSAQTYAPSIDSLKAVLSEEKVDTARVDLLNLIANEYIFSYPDTTYLFATQALELAKSFNYELGMAKSHIVMGNSRYLTSHYPSSLEHYFKSLELHNKVGDSVGIARSSLGVGNICYIQKNFESALEYYEIHLKIMTGFGSKTGIANSLGNIGSVYHELGEYKKALEYTLKDLELRKGLGRASNVAAANLTLALTYSELDMTSEALDAFQESIKIYESLDENRGKATTYIELGAFYQRLGEYQKAIELINKGLPIADEIGALDLKKHAYANLSEAHEAIGAYKVAFDEYKLYAQLKDSIFNEEKSKDLGRLEAKHEFETADAERTRALEVKSQKEKAERTRRDNLQYSGILIFMVLVFAGVFALGKISIPIRLAEGLIFFSFLLFFEFSLVMLDPYIEEYSSGAPAIKLAFNALLAGMIFPLHAFFETKLKSRLVKT